MYYELDADVWKKDPNFISSLLYSHNFALRNKCLEFFLDALMISFHFIIDIDVTNNENSVEDRCLVYHYENFGVG